MKRSSVLVCLAGLIAAIAGCSKEEPLTVPPASQAEAPASAPAPSAMPAEVSVVAVILGKSIGPDKKVTAAADSFAKNDTIYAVVETAGSGTATLKAMWTFHKGDKTAAVNESTQSISPTGPATSEFHVSKPDGWPAGDYQVQISLNDKPAGTKKFTVN